jgi:hypothetical protein
LKAVENYWLELKPSSLLISVTDMSLHWIM